MKTKSPPRSTLHLKSIAQWKNLPIFLAEIADLRSGIEASREEKQAAALVFANISYAQTEAIVGLKEGTLMEWVQEDAFWTNDNSFSQLLKRMKEGVPNKFTEAPEAKKGLNDDQVPSDTTHYRRENRCPSW